MVACFLTIRIAACPRIRWYNADVKERTHQRPASYKFFDGKIAQKFPRKADAAGPETDFARTLCAGITYMKGKNPIRKDGDYMGSPGFCGKILGACE